MTRDDLLLIPLRAPIRRTTAICRLLLCGRPLAIFGRIRAVVVDALDLKFWRGGAHVGQEAVEGKPLSAYDYPAPAITGVREAAAIEAAGLHSHPNIVGAGTPHAVGCVRSRRNDFALQTSARTSYPATESMRRQDNRCAAVTKTRPGRESPHIRSGASNRQALESHSTQVYSFPHKSHFSALLARVPL